MPLRYCPLCAEDIGAELCLQHDVPTVLIGGGRGQMSEGHIVAHRYLLGRPLPGSGMSRVFLATERPSGRQVVVKALDVQEEDPRSYLTRLYLEAQALGRVRNPNVVDILDFGVDRETECPYLVMEYAEGETLGERLRRVGSMSEAEARPVLLQVARALQAAHEEGVVHRDLKPDNVLLNEGRPGGLHVHVLDFGLAKITSLDAVTATLPGETSGTPWYMSPEQVLGAEVDHRTDLYALGCIAFRMLTGRMVYEEADPVQAMQNHASAVAPSLPARLPSGAPPSEAMRRLVDLLLAKSKLQRPEDAAWVIDALQQAPEAKQAGTSPIPGGPTLLDPKLAATDPVVVEDVAPTVPLDLETKPFDVPSPAAPSGSGGGTGIVVLLSVLMVVGLGVLLYLSR